MAMFSQREHLTAAQARTCMVRHGPNSLPSTKRRDVSCTKATACRPRASSRALESLDVEGPPLPMQTARIVIGRNGVVRDEVNSLLPVGILFQA